MLTADAIGDRGDCSKIRFSLGELGLKRGLQLLEIRAPRIVRRLGLSNDCVPLQLLRRIELEVALGSAQHRQRIPLEHWLRNRISAYAAQCSE
ncbi:MAG: hypothetical protein E6H55_11130 [Betaproteobacteria bacterium]|nr:MAG: hypothetical protein E6H55_11130 [Betaproteobacteria bacterium]